MFKRLLAIFLALLTCTAFAGCIEIGYIHDEDGNTLLTANPAKSPVADNVITYKLDGNVSNESIAAFCDMSGVNWANFTDVEQLYVAVDLLNMFIKHGDTDTAKNYTPESLCALISQNLEPASKFLVLDVACTLVGADYTYYHNVALKLKKIDAESSPGMSYAKALSKSDFVFTSSVYDTDFDFISDNFSELSKLFDGEYQSEDYGSGLINTYISDTGTFYGKTAVTLKKAKSQPCESVMIELSTINPVLTARNVGIGTSKTELLAAYRGLSRDESYETEVYKQTLPVKDVEYRLVFFIESDFVSGIIVDVQPR